METKVLIERIVSKEDFLNWYENLDENSKAYKWIDVFNTAAEFVENDDRDVDEYMIRFVKTKNGEEINHALVFSGCI